MPAKIAVMIALVIVAMLAGWLATRLKKREIAPVTEHWLRRGPGHVPYALIYTGIYGIVLAWAASHWPLTELSNEVFYVFVASLAFFSRLPWWWEYRGRGGYFVGRKVIPQATIVRETCVAGKNPQLNLAIRDGLREAIVTVRVPARLARDGGSKRKEPA